MMKQSDQITIVDPTISTPAWRNASPKYLKTRRRKISPKTRPENLTMSPKEATQSRGTASQPGTRRPSRGGPQPGTARPGSAGREGQPRLSLDHADFGVRRQERLGEDIVEREHAEERDHHRLVHRSTHSFGAAGRSHPFVRADDRDDRPKQGRLDDRPPQVDG